MLAKLHYLVARNAVGVLIVLSIINLYFAFGDYILEITAKQRTKRNSKRVVNLQTQ